MSADIKFYRATDIYIEQDSSSGQHWFTVTIFEDDENGQEITIFGNNKMPEVHFGDPNDRQKPITTPKKTDPEELVDKFKELLDV